jgi:hypothetical protein
MRQNYDIRDDSLRVIFYPRHDRTNTSYIIMQFPALRLAPTFA